MRSRTFFILSLVVLAALSPAQSVVDSLLFDLDGVSGKIAGVGIRNEIEIVEYKDSLDTHPHKRPGRAKFKNIVLKRGWTGESDGFDSMLAKVLQGTTDRKSGSVIYLDRAGQEILRQEFGGLGDFTAEFPGTGLLEGQDRTGGFKLTGLAHLYKEGIVHRDLAARNLLRAAKFNASLESEGGRVLACYGTSPLWVSADTGDLDGDGVPDFVSQVDSGPLTLLLGPEEAQFVRKWLEGTERAILDGTQFLVPITLNWGTSDGWVLPVTVQATLMSATPGPLGGVEVVCATETVVFRPHRGAVK